MRLGPFEIDDFWVRNSSGRNLPFKQARGVSITSGPTADE